MSGTDSDVTSQRFLPPSRLFLWPLVQMEACDESKSIPETLGPACQGSSSNIHLPASPSTAAVRVVDDGVPKLEALFIQ